MAKANAKQQFFTGFPRPQKNFFQMPNSWTDITAEMKSLAELKVVEYVLRHTWGFQEYGIAKRITTDEFMDGRKRTNRTRMDKGTGLSNRSVIDGLRRAVADGYLIEDVDDTDKARIRKSYQLRMAGRKNLPPDVKNLHAGVKKLDTGGKESSQRSEKDTLERHLKKNTVANGNQSSPVMRLPKLDQPDEKTDLIAQDILDQLGDDHSERFYRQVVSRISEEKIRAALAEIKADGAEHPARAFTYRMNQYARSQLKQAIGESEL
jgi:DNA-binding PadR family transcriptional regulator